MIRNNAVRRVLLGGLILLGAFSRIRAADLSIIVTAGPKYSLLGDINKGKNGYLDIWADLLRSSGGAVIDNKRPVHLGLSYSVDFFLALDTAYSVGLGVGYVRARNRSEVLISFTDGRPETSAVVETSVESVPIRLNILRHFHLTRSLNAFVKGGLELHNAKFQSSSWPAGPGDSHRQKAHSIGIGLLYGAGLEIKAVRHVALVFEAQGNYAKIGGFSGTRDSGGSSLPYEVKGDLYFEDMTSIPPDFEKTYPLLVIYENKPAGDRVRPARVDLSGFSLSVGLKIFF